MTVNSDLFSSEKDWIQKNPDQLGFTTFFYPINHYLILYREDVSAPTLSGPGD